MLRRQLEGHGIEDVNDVDAPMASDDEDGSSSSSSEPEMTSDHGSADEPTACDNQQPSYNIYKPSGEQGMSFYFALKTQNIMKQLGSVYLQAHVLMSLPACVGKILCDCLLRSLHGHGFTLLRLVRGGSHVSRYENDNNLTYNTCNCSGVRIFLQKRPS